MFIGFTQFMVFIFMLRGWTMVFGIGKERDVRARGSLCIRRECVRLREVPR